MNIKKNRLLLYVLINAVLLVAVIVFAVKLISGSKQNADAFDSEKPVSHTEKLYAHEEVKAEVVINTQVIEDGLRDMGLLISQEYYFTQVQEYKNTEPIWIFESTASFTYSYDGVVSAGIDCSKITVVKDDEQKIVTIKIPKAEIVSVSIDNDSFKKYEEKNGLWNKINLDKVNESLGAFKEKAKENALSKGILDNADKNAEKMILSFAKSLSVTEDYKIVTVRE